MMIEEQAHGPTLRYRRLRCPGSNGRSCPQILGSTNGRQLFLPGGVFTTSVAIHCPRPNCGGQVIWYAAPSSPNGRPTPGAQLT
jgi:hypothetical protein